MANISPAGSEIKDEIPVTTINCPVSFAEAMQYHGGSLLLLLRVIMQNLGFLKP